MRPRYSITGTDRENRRIFIHCRSVAYMGPEGLGDLLKRISSACSGEIYEVSRLCYMIRGDRYGLYYRWDDTFGAVIVYGADDDPDGVIKYIGGFLD